MVLYILNTFSSFAKRWATILFVLETTVFKIKLALFQQSTRVRKYLYRLFGLSSHQSLKSSLGPDRIRRLRLWRVNDVTPTGNKQGEQSLLSVLPLAVINDSSLPSLFDVTLS